MKRRSFLKQTGLIGVALATQGHNVLAAAKQSAVKGKVVDYTSKVPEFTFANTLVEQEKQLKNNPLMLRFAASRLKLSTDPYRPAYHFVTPESTLNDPNSIVFWQGRWHLFFIAMPPDEFPNPADIMKRWHHTSIGTHLIIYRPDINPI